MLLEAFHGEHGVFSGVDVEAERGEVEVEQVLLELGGIDVEQAAAEVGEGATLVELLIGADAVVDEDGEVDGVVEADADFMDAAGDVSALGDLAADRGEVAGEGADVHLALAAGVDELAVEEADAAATDVAGSDEVMDAVAAELLDEDDQAGGDVVADAGVAAHLGAGALVALELGEEGLAVGVAEAEGVDVLGVVVHGGRNSVTS
jgi:hypothetical protein